MVNKRELIVLAFFALSGFVNAEVASDGVGQKSASLDIEVSNGKISLAMLLAKDVAIDYKDSGSQQAELGNGFAIEYASKSVLRCQQNGGRAVELAQVDKFCVDGSALVPLSGTSGISAAEYRLESDPHSRIISQGGNNSTNPAEYTGPEYFEVHRRDNTTSFYGRTPDSKLERIRCGGTTGVACATVQWALNRTVDNLGNYVDYIYQENPVTIPAQPDGTTIPGTEQVLKRIEYGGRLNLPGQSGATQAHYGQIEFDYITRPASTWRIDWMADSRAAQTQELTRIRVSERNNQNQLVQLRSYRMTYADSASGAGARLLTAITECRDDTASTVCLKPTVFTWSQARNGVPVAPAAQVGTSVSNTSPIIDVSVGDLDADGMQDIVYVDANRKLYSVFGSWIGTPGSSTFQFQQPSQTPLSLLSTTNFTDFDLIDMDGDGRDDVVMAIELPDGRFWRVFRSLGRPTVASGRVFAEGTGIQLTQVQAFEDTVVGDFSGDGVIDMLYRRPNTANVVLGADHRMRRWQRLREGPKLTDELPVRFEFAPSSFCATQNAATGRVCKLEKFNGQFQRFLEDFDGDGAADLFAFIQEFEGGTATGRRSFHVMRFSGFEINAGQETAVFRQLWVDVSSTIRPAATSGLIQPPQVADFTGDGLPDLVYKLPAPSTSWRLLQNTGKGFAEELGLEITRAGSSPNQEWNVQNTSFTETNGNGRVDVMYYGDSTSTTRLLEWRPDGTVKGTVVTAANVGGGLCPATTWLTATQCNQALSQGYYQNLYTDINGDGASDLLMIYRGALPVAPNTQILYTLAESPYQPRDVITEVTDGFGAKTSIRYAPLTNRAVYIRDVNSRVDPAPNNPNVTQFGRGSPVLDMLSPMYVVVELTTSSPTFGGVSNVSRTRYRYAGAKVQLGGRGFLGFREVTSFDDNHTAGASTTGQTVISRTTYRQDFPFVGMPASVERFVRPGGFVLDVSNPSNNSLLLACHADSKWSQGCFATAPIDTTPATQQHPSAGGVLVSSARMDYGCIGLSDIGNGAAGEQCEAPWNGLICPVDLMDTALTFPVADKSVLPFRGDIVKPVFPFLRLQDERVFDLQDGASAQRTVSAYCYTDSFGNPTQTVTAHFDRSGNEVARQRTFNTYINSVTEVPGTEPVMQWRIGRLASTASTTRRPNPANPGQFLTRSRNANFLYDFTAPMRTGLLIGESAEPGAGEVAAPFVRQRYFHDVFGNRTLTMTCSNDVPLTDCDDPTDVSKVRMQPAAVGLGSRVHRYSKTQFDARGRYEVATRSPYFSPTAVNNLVELTDSEVLSRDVFGQPTHVRKLVDPNVSSYAESKSEYGVLGRLSRTMTETAEGLFGVESNIRYRWCPGRNQGVDEVDCPVDAVYRQETTTTEQPTVWTYFDPLARPIIEVKQSFNDPNDPKIELRAGFANKQLVATCVYFDRRGREARRSEPFFLTRAPVAGAPSFNNGADVPCTADRLWTLRDYDALDRPRRVSEPNGAYTEIKIGRAISATADPLSERRETFRGQTSGDVLMETIQKNPMGEVVSTTDMQGLVVQYFYDPYGNQSRVLRDGGGGVVETIHVHDAMGRKISETDPDSGVSTFAYNGAGEVVRTQDARGVVVNSEYDARGRLVKRRTQLPRFNISGQVSGLSGGALTLQLNGANDITVSQSGGFIFNNLVTLNSDYAVTISNAPAALSCTVQNGQGSLVSANVSNVQVQCVPNGFAISGTLSGLNSGNAVVLRNSVSQENITLTQNGSFSFVNLLTSGSAYTIVVQSQPTQQTCAVSNGSGTVSGANINNVQVTCTTNTYTVGGTLSGLLSGRSLVLRLNGAQNLTLTSNGSFQFANPIPHASSFAVTVLTLPLGQTCTLNNGSGTVNAANVTSVQVVCVQRSAAFGSLPAPGATIDFGALAVGQSSERTILVANGAPEGSADLAISCALPAGSAFQFSGLSFPINLVAPAERELRIRLMVPQGSAGILSVQLQCTHNAGGASTTVNWTLTGSVAQESIFRSGFEAP